MCIYIYIYMYNIRKVYDIVYKIYKIVGNPAGYFVYISCTIFILYMMFVIRLLHVCAAVPTTLQT